MAGSRTAASLSLTVGVAVATLVVAGGILAGPSIVDCAQHSGSIGACLRGKVVDSGLLPAAPAAPSSFAAPVSAGPLPSVAVLPPRNSGWIEANATEYETPPQPPAELRAVPGRLDVVGAAPSTVQIDGHIAVAEPDVALRATGFGNPGTGASGTVDVPGTEALTPAVQGQAGLTAHGAGHVSLAPQLVADLAPAQPLTEIAPPPPAAPHKLAPRKLSPPAGAGTAHSRRSPAVKYDPRYPNVVVLPPPNTGENSSFATLELR